MLFWRFFWWLFTPQGETFIKATMAAALAGILVTAAILSEKEGKRK